MKTIIKWTMWQRRWSTLWWSVAVFGLIFINMIFYPTFKDQALELQKSFEKLPEAAVQLFGGSTDFFSSIGFVNSQVYFLMLPLILGILAIGMGSSLLGREEQDHTLEILLARPISRNQILLAKAIVGKLILLIVTIVGWLTVIITGRFVGIEISILDLSIATLACYLLALSFGAIAYFLSATGKARGASIGIATLMGLGGYIISSLSGTVKWLKTPSHFFPFDYYQTEAILRGNTNWRNMLILVLITIVCAFLSWFSFRKRDIN